MNLFKHFWYVWIRNCDYAPDKFWVDVLRYAYRVEIVHQDGEAYYVRVIKGDDDD